MVISVWSDFLGPYPQGIASFLLKIMNSHGLVFWCFLPLIFRYRGPFLVKCSLPAGNIWAVCVISRTWNNEDDFPNPIPIIPVRENSEGVRIYPQVTQKISGDGSMGHILPIKITYYYHILGESRFVNPNYYHPPVPETHRAIVPPVKLINFHCFHLQEHIVRSPGGTSTTRLRSRDVWWNRTIWLWSTINYPFLIYYYSFLVGGWPTPLKNIGQESVGMIIPNWMEKQKMFQTTNQIIY